jgi:hypothetical protein
MALKPPSFNVGDHVIIRSIKQPGIVAFVDSQQFGIPNNHTYGIRVGEFCIVSRVAYENLELA